MGRTFGRRDLLRAAGAAGVTSLAGCTDWVPRDAIDRLSRGTDTVWPTYRYDAGNTGYAPDHSGPAAPDELWAVDEGGRWGTLTALDDERVFGGIATENDSDLVAHDRDGGDEAWNEGLDGDTAPFPVLHDGVVVAGGRDAVRAFAADSGDERWAADLGGEWAGAQAVVDGVVVAIGDAGDEVTVAALDFETGDEVWDASFDARTVTAAVADGVVYAAIDPGDGSAKEVRALGLDDGDERWDHRIEGMRLYNQPVADGERVYVTLRRPGLLVALDAGNGHEEWRFESDVAIVDTAIVDGQVITGDGGDVVALDADGDEDWRTDTDHDLVFNPVVGSDRIYVGSYDPGTVYAFDHRGNEEWRYETDTLWIHAPIFADGVAYCGSYDPGRLVALGGG